MFNNPNSFIHFQGLRQIFLHILYNASFLVDIQWRGKAVCIRMLIILKWNRKRKGEERGREEDFERYQRPPTDKRERG